ncbi:MAG: isoleucine--tRNA ligase [Planctomycetes bacterium]|nr:isoleucine--tRNA ligase [Planctomycetota bacterium]
MPTKNYKDTINLPKTDFPQQANLTKMEPRIRERWEHEHLYEKILAARRGSPRGKWILHDGPPYANGDVHVGTGQNKVLKDVVVKFRTMQGCLVPFVPGWDCHGLPIEQKALQQLGPKAKTAEKAEIRRLCEEFARNYIDIQRRQFKSLGVLGDWERPYLTLDPTYELSIVEVFEELWKRGHVYRRRKSIRWCPFDRTALAEAELEYKALPSPSIYLAFELVGRSEAQDLLVWTTTPWTLPADVAVAAHPQLEDAIVDYEGARGKRRGVIAPQRIEECRKLFAIGETVGTITGKELEGWKYKHPLFDHECPVVLANYVTVSDGTGLVHTAPGHGAEDYETGLKYNLPILSPVDESGHFTKEAVRYAGLQVFEADRMIIGDLRASGVLIKDAEFTHDYPCCWRCKKPVIFRATEQWFIAVDHADGRRRALEAVGRTRWVPAWGEKRIRSMLEERPDWCVSRQRTWGVPIPAFYCGACNKEILNETTFGAVKALFAVGGANAWFTTSAKEILPQSFRCPHCGGAEFRKEEDIFDVWFESGSSHRAVCMKHPDLNFPADLYLEGTDQHRGWFQLSLLASLLSNGQAPFKTVVTHGFLVDARTKDKISKSAPGEKWLLRADEIVNRIGADLLRLWICSIDFTDDIPFSKEILEGMADPYKKIRNTFRYLLGNLHDFDPSRDRVRADELLELDRWALEKLSSVVADVTKHFENYEFSRTFHRLHDFCVVDMSSVYFDVLKDRLYTYAAGSRERRSAQTALHEILMTLVKALAPILAHTCEEVWEHLPGSKEAGSVHLALWPARPIPDAALLAKFEKLLRARDEVNRRLERLRAAGEIGKSLEAQVEIHAQDADLQAALLSANLEELFIVSQVIVMPAPIGEESEAFKGLHVRVKKSPHAKCERCWALRPTVGRNAEHPTLCARCAAAINA